MTLEDLVGETLVFGIPGTRVRPADVRLFRETRAGGLILYRINYESPEQVRRLVRDLEEALGRRLLVTADHEGGRVVMFGGGATVFPDSLAFGAAASPADARRHGAIEGRELRRLGVDANFAPVVDILTEAYSPNIGIRSYGADAARVASLACARIAGMQAAGVSACAKHFPGLGPASLDPHLDLPVIRLGWAEMRRRHLKPFERAIAAGVDMVMSSHPLYPRLDPSPRTPATFSRRLIEGCLRRELGFDGVIASDDLEMGAVRKLCSAGRAAVLAARAGHDLLLSCHDAAYQRRVFEALRRAYRDGELSLSDLERTVERVRRLKERHPARFAPGKPRPEPGGVALARRVAREAVVVRTVPSRARGLEVFLKNGRAPERRWRGRSVLAVFPRLSAFSRTILVEKEFANEKRFVAGLLAKLKPAVFVADVDPRPREIAAAARAARARDVTLFFCQDARMYRGCGRLLKALSRAARELVVVLMRDPYDVSLLPPGTTVVTAFGYRAAQVRACAERLLRG